ITLGTPHRGAPMALAAAVMLRVFGSDRAPHVSAFVWLAVLAKPLISLAGGTLVHVTAVPRQWAAAEPVGGMAAIAPWVALAWLIGVFVFAGRMIRDWWRADQIIRNAVEPSDDLADFYRQLAGRSRAPRLRVSSAVTSPAIAGWIRPVILIPSWMATNEAPREQLFWSLRHELMHARRLDTLAGLVRRISEALLFFHPLVWWAGSRWERSVELACDRAVARSSEEAAIYASQLYRILIEMRKQGERPPVPAMSMMKTEIGRRIRTLLDRPARPARMLPVAVLIFAAAAACAGLTYQPPRPAANPDNCPDAAKHAPVSPTAPR
ncbi:MAG: M56 family metallopeptidase, partial [Candidatus Eisenbacteria bacterium]